MTLGQRKSEIGAGSASREPGTLNHIDIQITVIVIIEYRGPGTHDFRHIILPG
jgi:hypothetical protein